MASVSDFAAWRWRWEDMCGPGGLNLWSKELHDVGLCFQQLCLQIPVLALLAIVSAYYCGRQAGYVVRGRLQMRAVNSRCYVVLGLAVLPVIQAYIDIGHAKDKVLPIKAFLSAVQCVTWVVHLAYVIALRRRLGISPRGPVYVCVFWTLYAILTAVSLHSHYLIYVGKFPADPSDRVAYAISIVALVLQLMYAVTLIPSEGSTELRAYSSRYIQIGEQQPLLSSSANHAFNRFLEEQDPHYLGVAMEESAVLSRLLFYWVNPLVTKGAEKKLNHPDDLFDLPVELSCGSVSLKLEKALVGGDGEADDRRRRRRANAMLNKNYEDDDGETSYRSYGSIETSPEISFRGATGDGDTSGKRYRVSLLGALHRCFWFEFYSIGGLRFLSDCAGFAGPMLLNRLVGFIENKDEDLRLGYLYAAGLCITTTVGALCNSHFNFFMSTVGLKIRASLVTAVYRKTLTVDSTTLKSAFSVGEIVNFMSTDADRIVNSCPSFHAVWSIPLQLAVTLYLLYEQVGLAFLSGVAFSVVLIPVNKLIAGKIGQLSTKLMERKDERVKMTAEVLRGIRTIKLHVWEDHFVNLITRLRAGELRYLKGRKYLDALCVYFWATTPVLISILTFLTYVSLGNKLTAATVFTSMALLNMLIGPLNAFPWVLNGVTEAWVSIKRVQRLLDLPDLDLEAYYGKADGGEDGGEEPHHVAIKSGSFHWNSGGDFHLSSINLNVKRGQLVGIMGQVGSGKSSLLAAILAEITRSEGEVDVAGGLELGIGYVSQQAWIQRGTVRDNILFGKAYDDGRYKKVLFACCLAEDVRAFANGDLTGIGEGGATLSGGQKARIALARAVYQDKPIYLLDDVLSAVDRNVARHIFQHCIVGLLSSKTRILCTHQTEYLVHADRLVSMEGGKIVREGRPSEILQDYEEHVWVEESSDGVVAAGQQHPGEVDCDSDLTGAAIAADDDRSSLLDEEYSETGAIESEVYGYYWTSVGHLLAASILISLALMQASRNMTDWWLSYWVSHSLPANGTGGNGTDWPNDTLRYESIGDATDDGADVRFYASVYGGFVGVNSVFTLARAFLFAYGGIRAAACVHRALLRSVVGARATFFDVTPLGRILNRFSSDTYTIDDSLPFIVNVLLAQAFGLLGAVIVIVYGLPWLCLVLGPLVPLYHWLQHRYRATSRELKRLSSTTLSPVYGHFNETLQGLVTIRALRASQRFKRDNEDNVEANQKAQFAGIAAAQWLGLRLQLIGVALVTAVGVVAVVQHQFEIAVDAGLVGLAVSYALSVTGLLGGVVNAFTETEREMVAVERARHYVARIEPERGAVAEPPFAWPSQGVVAFERAVMRYRDHLPPSLASVTFETRPAEKLAVVGRTGAGKSSLLAALFRVCDLSSGRVLVDAVDVSRVSIRSLRTRLSIIPQDPFLFSGTVRDNLDPLAEHQDQELWTALSRVNLDHTIRRMGGLLSDHPTDLSAGQRQLLCLARALLRNAKILCIDEATANVDNETDRLIQHTLRTAFRKSTVITIAHRVRTVLDYDRVLVMAEGRVLEFDEPNTLLADESSYFSKLVKQQQ